MRFRPERPSKKSKFLDVGYSEVWNMFPLLSTSATRRHYHHQCPMTLKPKHTTESIRIISLRLFLFFKQFLILTYTYRYHGNAREFRPITLARPATDARPIQAEDQGGQDRRSDNNRTSRWSSRKFIRLH